jgi:hypothetical protein
MLSGRWIIRTLASWKPGSNPGFYGARKGLIKRTFGRDNPWNSVIKGKRVKNTKINLVLLGRPLFDILNQY